MFLVKHAEGRKPTAQTVWGSVGQTGMMKFPSACFLSSDEVLLVAG